MIPLKALPTLVAALLGGVVAWSWFSGGIVLGLAFTGSIVALVLVSRAQYARGRGLVRRDAVAGMHAMEWFVAVPIGIGALVAGLAIALAVWFEPSDDATVQTKKLLAAVFGALTGFLGATFTKGLDDIDANYIAPRIKSAFEALSGLSGDAHAAAFDDVYKGQVGWGPEARGVRAAGVKAGQGTTGRAWFVSSYLLLLLALALIVALLGARDARLI